LTNEYLLDQGGNQFTELNNAVTGTTAMGWAHSNVWAAGLLSATYDTLGLHFHLSDPLGTRRVQIAANGAIEETCQSLPFGDFFNCAQTSLATADDATENHFTGKERDTESGNDYFGARYYASTMGRFMSGDPVIITPLRLADPQRLNLYSYGRNNPLSYIDPRGEDITMVNDTDNGRELARQKMTKGMTAAEAANIGVKQDKHGKWEAVVNDKGAIDMKHASVAYKGVTGVINDHSVNVNLGLVGGGLTATFPDYGRISSTSEWAQTLGSPGQRDVDVIVTQGDVPHCCEVLTPFGTMRGSEPDFVSMYHELVGETLKYRAGHGNLLNDPILDSNTVIKIENELRNSQGMYPRTGSDHGPQVITVNGGSSN
jgi:RHS repeat-associated protein